VPAERTGTARAAASYVERLRVLIADDDPDLLDLVSGIIDHLGLDVVRASTGGELLDRLADQGPYDLIITDVSMPWMTGLQVVHSARVAGVPCPIIVMTALRDLRTTAQVEALGERVVLLHKPFSSEDLFGGVCALLPAVQIGYCEGDPTSPAG
jgi:CheY-like chemotaxis protein